MANVYHAQLSDGAAQRARRRVLLLAALVLGGGTALADVSPADVAARRQEILNDMMASDYLPALIANARRSCALGQEPARVAEARSQGAYFTPDVADSCVTALVRTARDHHLADLYGKLVAEVGGSSDASEKLPRAIGAAVLNNATNVAIGNGKAAIVTSALAFDAGFTVAYQDGALKKAVNAERLKALAEDCLAQRQDAGTCFSVGYVYGARAFNGETISAR
jgi:hypothetical protein